ncbi:type IV pilus modification protein PilV [Ramlibacter sp. Leaf400]|uniref:type IV pilus modification protein PilV n=1 Tax=Ramlibacter sp. Leaf400 TaxID=1736365 RepID=UPI0006F26484|nr:type IV pilus modification protein PilV [Ramlibacter sp. Leaf400]
MNRPKSGRAESGATLLEVLVSVLILSLGMLSLSSMMAFTVQMPKLSGYRATAATIASSHIERIRANRAGFLGGDYSTNSSYDGSFNPIVPQICDYPNCTATSLAMMDDAATKLAARETLPAGGVLTTCDPQPCTANSMGNIWVIWQEPATRAILDPSSSDNCPTAYGNPRPRCLYARFKP